MAYRVTMEKRAAADGLDGTIYILADQAGTARADVWPALGFNCFRWQAAVGDEAPDLLYADPHLFEGARPTRSGIPILFPFPNRIRGGRFGWDGRDYQLPRNDPAEQNAIHGFACRRPWRVVEHGADGEGAWVTGEFVGSVDAADARDLWPADYRIRVTCRLGRQSLRLEAVVDNPDRRPLPFGLGYHPYLRVPLLPPRLRGWRPLPAAPGAALTAATPPRSLPRSPPPAVRPRAPHWE